MKNIYGKNVAWFCYEGAINLSDIKQEGSHELDDEFEVYGEDEEGREGRCSVDVISLLESAYAEIERLNAENEKLLKELKNETTNN